MNIRLLQPIGFLRSGHPVYPVAGGSGDDDQTDADAGGGGADDDAEGDGGTKWTPPSRAEWLRVQNALVKANGSAKVRREALAEKDKTIAELQAAQARREADDERRALSAAAAPPVAPDTGGKGKKGGRGGAPAPAPAAPAPLPDSILTKAQVKQMVAEAAKEAKALAAAEMNGKLATRAAREALVGEGVSKTKVARLVQLVELDDIEFDDDGEVVGGLDEQVEQLKLDFPELFKPAESERKAPKRAPVTRATAAGRTEQQQRPQSSAEKMAAQIMGTR